jgi:hypothetical protein
LNRGIARHVAAIVVVETIAVIIQQIVTQFFGSRIDQRRPDIFGIVPAVAFRLRPAISIQVLIGLVHPATAVIILSIGNPPCRGISLRKIRVYIRISVIAVIARDIVLVSATVRLIDAVVRVCQMTILVDIALVKAVAVLVNGVVGNLYLLRMNLAVFVIAVEEKDIIIIVVAALGPSIIIIVDIVDTAIAVIVPLVVDLFRVGADGGIVIVAVAVDLAIPVAIIIDAAIVSNAVTVRVIVGGPVPIFRSAIDRSRIHIGILIIAVTCRLGIPIAIDVITRIIAERIRLARCAIPALILEGLCGCLTPIMGEVIGPFVVIGV